MSASDLFSRLQSLIDTNLPKILRDGRNPEAFESALANVIALNNPACIVPLTAFLKDKSSNDHVMFSIIHAIESFDDATYTRELLKALPVLVDSAPDWAGVLVMRVLNSPLCLEALVNCAERAQQSEKDALGILVANINNEDEVFLSRTQRVLNVL